MQELESEHPFYQNWARRTLRYSYPRAERMQKRTQADTQFNYGQRGKVVAHMFERDDFLMFFAPIFLCPFD